MLLTDVKCVNMNEPSKSLLIRTDVTALKIIKNDYLLAGIGNTLSLYRISSNCLLASLEIFIGQKIHGIVPSRFEDNIILYGGKRCKEVSLILNEIVSISLIEFDLNCDDWIMSLIWTDDSSIAILTAHNIVQIWNIQSGMKISTHECNDKCILYSGLLYKIKSDIIVMSGTVFSHVIIWNANSSSVYQKLIGHKGVIFSISYNEHSNMIVTTSDDRSTRIWIMAQENSDDNDSQNIEYWKNNKIIHKATMFGHTARVMRNFINSNNIISIGEDSLICIWDMEGNLINKKRISQDNCLWSIDCSETNDVIIIGGSNSGVVLQSLSSLLNANENNELLFPSCNKMTPKVIVHTYRNNIACLTEQGDLIYYDFELKTWTTKHLLNKYSHMTISKCRQFLALSNISGDINIIAERCKFKPELIECIQQKIIKGHLLSLHWLCNRNIIVCDNQGIISIWSSKSDILMKDNEFVLPFCKERWLTTAFLIYKPTYILIIGDRCGNIHLYQEESIQPIQTLRKVHGRLGTNSIEFLEKNIIMTTGKDSTVKYFKLVTEDNETKCCLKFMYNIKLPFVWIENFIEKDDIVCGFQESYFIIRNIKCQQNIFEINCGGGHRSWDIKKKWLSANKHCYFQLIFIKNSKIYLTDLKVHSSITHIIQGFHTREINTMKIICINEQKNNKIDNSYLCVSAGEDTSLRFSLFQYNYENLLFNELINVSKHLSSIKSLYIYPLFEKPLNKFDKSFFLFSTGGRAQICVWKIFFSNLLKNSNIECQEVANYFLKGSDFERKGSSGWQQVKTESNAETRVMSVICFTLNESNKNEILIENDFFHDLWVLVGCSDGSIHIFSFTRNGELYNMALQTVCQHRLKCILILDYFIFKSHFILLSFLVDGTIVFWNYNSYLELDSDKKHNFTPFHEMKIHKGGINSHSIKSLSEDSYVIATGGDDNSLHLNIISLKSNLDTNDIEVKSISEWYSDKYHCAQITGFKFINDDYIISTSIDQRITLLKYLFDKDSLNIECTFINQYHSSISDIQGLNILFTDENNVTLCVYGRGIEYMLIKINGMEEDYIIPSIL